MVRIMIQLTETQRKRLKRLADEKQISVSELVRRGVDLIIGCEIADPEARKRAREAVGFADFGIRDLADRHDDYYAEAVGQ